MENERRDDILNKINRMRDCCGERDGYDLLLNGDLIETVLRDVELYADGVGINEDVVILLSLEGWLKFHK